MPALWLYEVTNVCTLAVRKGRLPKAKAIIFLNNLVDLPIEVEAPANRAYVLQGIADLMERHRLTAYDAAYLELVIRRDLPLATLDGALISACTALGKRLV